MPGNPTKPYYFPLIDRGKRTGKPLATFWRAENISGSWSPGSIRRQQGGGWLGANESAYAMAGQSRRAALSQMLYGKRVSALAVGAYFLRNDGFVLSAEPTPNDVILGFRAKFGYENDSDFAQLFTADVPQVDFEWFEAAGRLRSSLGSRRMFEELVPNVRTLTADDLGIGVQAAAASSHASSSPDAPEIPADHPMIREIIRLAKIFGGVILSGPQEPRSRTSPLPLLRYSSAAMTTACGSSSSMPATSTKTSCWASAQRTRADSITSKVRSSSSFAPAETDPENTYVLVIDELSRADVGRVFGEALTYVERTKRELPFNIANGDKIKVPSNFVILATMNPFDRGVDEVDAAFERRFAKISMDPDRELLDELLTDNDMDEALKKRVIGWFSLINGYGEQERGGGRRPRVLRNGQRRGEPEGHLGLPTQILGAARLPTR